MFDCWPEVPKLLLLMVDSHALSRFTTARSSPFTLTPPATFFHLAHPLQKSWPLLFFSMQCAQIQFSVSTSVFSRSCGLEMEGVGIGPSGGLTKLLLSPDDPLLSPALEFDPLLSLLEVDPLLSLPLEPLLATLTLSSKYWSILGPAIMLVGESVLGFGPPTLPLGLAPVSKGFPPIAILSSFLGDMYSSALLLSSSLSSCRMDTPTSPVSPKGLPLPRPVGGVAY
mmetsp:Transcript_1037/g.1745  ORF Transcript_1037/g.1745 Transcript_1037/m.1745 type:complete len:226 (-) Transcript_1037:404-1081(-)